MGGVELVTPLFGQEALWVAVSQSWSTPACLAWLELRRPIHSHSWHITHSTHCAPPPSTLQQHCMSSHYDATIKHHCESLTHRIWYNPTNKWLHEIFNHIVKYNFTSKNINIEEQISFYTKTLYLFVLQRDLNWPTDGPKNMVWTNVTKVNKKLAVFIFILKSFIFLIHMTNA